MILRDDDLRKLKVDFPCGCTVKLTKMDDVHMPPIGSLGKVTEVDDIGTIHVIWETGFHLGVVYGFDECIRVD